MKRNYFLLSIIAVSALLVRLYRIAEYNFWYDESLHILSAKQMSFDLTGKSWFSNFPPFFDFLLKLWMKLGEGEFILRLLPLLFSMAALGVVFLLGKRLFDFRTGVVATLIIAFMPFQIYYAQDLGPYSLYQFLCLLSLYLLVKFLSDDKKIALVYFIAFINLIAMYTHYLAGLFIVTQTIYLLLVKYRNRRVVIHWFLAHLIFLSAFLPHFAAACQTFGRYRASVFNYGQSINFQTIFSIFSNFLFGYHNVKQFVYVGGGVLLVYLLAGGVLIKQQSKRILFIVIITFPFLLSLILFQQYMVLLPRYFIWLSPFVYLLLSRFLIRGNIVTVKVVLGAVLIVGCAISLPRYYDNSVIAEKELRYGVFPKLKFKDSIKLIEDNLKPDDAIVHASMFTYRSFQVYRGKIEPREFRVYLPGNTRWKGDLGGYSNYKVQMPKEPLSVDNSFIPVDISTLKNKYRRVWFVTLSEATEFYEKKRWFQENMYFVKSFHKDSVEVSLFKRRQE